jgi:hypothetical protein
VPAKFVREGVGGPAVELAVEIGHNILLLFAVGPYDMLQAASEGSY